MSYSVVARIIARYNGPAKLTLLILADFANDNGDCFPSQTLIAARTGRQPRQVRRDLEALIAQGVLVKTRAGGMTAKGRFTSNAYRIDVAVIASMPVLDTVGRECPTVTDDRGAGESATVGHVRPLTVGHVRPHNQSSEPVIEPTTTGGCENEHPTLRDLEKGGVR